MATIETRVISVMAEQLRIPKNELKPSSSVVDDLGADSLETVELIMAIEDEFALTIPEQDASKFITIKDVIDYVTKTSPS
ncbi:acyl carrier protein [Pseudomonas sp. MAFF212428]|uniref:Acyl carrier protein n=1 Tax=Pseudomonas brassicae TaxID=2708063 RepID=A0A6B3NQ33_9PSED|nr:acyl carrier protein [Pseudomonas brassicae]NER61820.1 acyl carrier protein [Pseudomonas brassicae]NER65482.1 acyl carrier protein [Pseudomonas brassicae]